MEWGKVKNIIILILLLINGFLLVLVGARTSEVRRYEQSAIDRSMQVLAENGIQVDEGALPAGGGVEPAGAERDVAAEGRLVSALMGESLTGIHRGGGLYTYEGARGQVNVRAGGELSLTPSDSTFWVAEDPESHAAALMAALPVKTELVRTETNGDVTDFTYRQQWAGAPLFSCQATLTYQDGRLTDLSGSLLAADRSTEESAKLLTLPTVLMRFLDEILSSGDVCSSIRAVEPGYRMTQSFSGAVRLTSVWRISTNTADYYLDGVTGELTRAAESRSAAT